MEQSYKKFFKKGGLFLLSAVILLFLINAFFIQTVYNIKNPVRNYQQFVAMDKADLAVLFFGDSHPARGINPGQINPPARQGGVSQSFNFAVPSENYEQTFYKVRMIINKYPAVEVFVFPWDLHSFNNYRLSSYNETRYWLNFMTYDELSNLTAAARVNLMLRAAWPFIGKGEELIKLLENRKKKTEIHLGWQKNEENFTSEKNMSLAGIDRVQSQLKSYPDIVNPALIDSFLKIIDLLKSHHKTIILIKYPVTAEYLNALDLQGIDRTAYYANIYTRLPKYDNLYLWDFQETYKNNEELFSDPDHLNAQGADIFSRQIYGKMKELNFLN